MELCGFLIRRIRKGMNIDMYDIRHRQASKLIEIRDKAGELMRNTPVIVKQTGRDFKIGINGFDVMAYINAKSSEEKAFFKDRTEKALAVFNFFTLPMYWGIFEPEEGITLKEECTNAAKLLKDHHAFVKGHPLCWHTVCADWLLKYDDEMILKKQIERVHREVTDFAGLIDAWDVINETVIMPKFDKYDNAITRICKKYGRIPLIKALFDEAVSCKTGAKLILNDFNVTDRYEKVIEECLEAGVKIDVIGIQSHQHQGCWGKEKLLEVIDRFSRFGIPIHFTENTIVSGSLIPKEIEDLNDWQVEDWPSTEEGEARQSEEMEEMYRILFASPAVEAVTWWDFCDGAWLGAPSGLLRKDSSLKPVYKKLHHMVNEEWTTNYEAMTDDCGRLILNGYKGEYTILANGQTIRESL